MNSSLASQLGISPEWMHWVIVPLLIYLARVCDVSINTLRVIFMLNGKKALSTVMGFFEAFIWLVAISQILQNIDNVMSYFAYSGGFASGILTGMMIESRLAIGNVLVRVVTQEASDSLVSSLKEEGYRLTVVEGKGKQGAVNIIFLVIKRQKLNGVIHKINDFNPKAFYTIESVRHVNEEADTTPVAGSFWFSFLRAGGRK